MSEQIQQPFDNRRPPTNLTEDRLTMTFQAHHESFGEEPSSIHWAFADLLESKEQPYRRRLDVGEEGVDVELGWLKDNHGLMIIINKAGSTQQVNPTEEERQQYKKQELLVMQDNDGKPWIVRPGRLHVGEPSSSQLRLQSLHGTIPVTLIVFPR